MRARISEALKLVYIAYQFVRGGRRRLFRAFAGEREAKKERGKKRKRQTQKKKKREFALFPPTHSGNPVSEPKAAWQGESKGLE